MLLSYHTLFESSFSKIKVKFQSSITIHLLQYCKVCLMLRPRLKAPPALHSQRDFTEHCQTGKTSSAPLMNREESIRLITHRVGSGKNLLPTDSLRLPASSHQRTSPDGQQQQLIPARRATSRPACTAAARALAVGLAVAHHLPEGPAAAHRPSVARAPAPGGPSFPSCTAAGPYP